VVDVNNRNEEVVLMYRFGVDYYPEHWPQERWQEDARLMQAAGMNVARLAEFAWSRLEPRPDTYDFTWLDRAIEVLNHQGIQVILGTPTASPPPWVMEMLPDAFIVDASGVRRTFGNRREYCPSHAGYRERGRKVVQAMAHHYADHPGVIGWQTDNEFGDYCYCEICRAAFHDWLIGRYGTLESLNAAWGTVFWSHVYTDWAQIPTPAETGRAPNPGLALDYSRFMSDTYVEFQREHVAILRAASSKQFITHNFMGFRYNKLDYFDLAGDLDLVSWDNYPRLAWRMQSVVDPAPLALGHDAMRGLKGKNFWVMEEQSGAGGWTLVGMTPRPGEIRLWTWQAIAHGADGMVYFRWRTARHGTEQYWHGILDHDARPRRRYHEVQAIGQELATVGDRLVGAECRNEVAIVSDYASRWALQIQPNNEALSSPGASPDSVYPAIVTGYYTALHAANVGVDIIPAGADLSRYKLVIAPALYVLSVEVAASLTHFVEAGGTLITTARSGVKDVANAVVDMPLPGLLRELCGVEVDEYDSLPAGESVPVLFEGAAYLSGPWCDVLEPTTAETLARYDGGFYKGRAAITANRHGKGRAVYVGTLAAPELERATVRYALAEAGVRPVLDTPDGVEAAMRCKNGDCILFLLNHSDEHRTVALPFVALDLLNGRHVEGSVTIAPKDVLVLREE
jgi:beta-galactosidase